MPFWLRYQAHGRIGFGRLEGRVIKVHSGDMFDSPIETNERLALGQVRVLTPCVPTKIIALWNNFHALAAKLNQPIPAEPLYLLKAPSSALADREVIRQPTTYPGKVVFEGELGIVIGRRAREISEAEAGRYILGYTCVNDVTAAGIIDRDSTFAQWSKAKSFDTFGVFGPVVTTELNLSDALVKVTVDGQERQSYPISDMVFSPTTLVSLLSHDMTLERGDLICCGTSVGVGSMKPGNEVVVDISGVGRLANRFE